LKLALLGQLVRQFLPVPFMHQVRIEPSCFLLMIVPSIKFAHVIEALRIEAKQVNVLFYNKLHF
jgi:hypothetical protein